jgi:hypothetical protein
MVSGGGSNGSENSGSGRSSRALTNSRRLRYALGDTENKVGADIGHVLVAVQWVFNPERLSPVDQPLDWNNPAFECKDEVDEPVLNELNIFLIKAYGLKVMDKNMFSKGGSSDPMVSFTIGDEIMKSTTKKKTLEPVWEEKFQLPVKSTTATLTCTVDDYDMASGNDFMGKFEVPLADLADRQEHRQWYAMCGEGERGSEASVRAACERNGRNGRAGGRADRA